MPDALFLADALPAQGPEADFAGAVVMLLGVASIASWAWLVALWRRNESPIPFVPRLPAPWRLGEVAAVIGFVLVTTIAGAVIPTETDQPISAADFSYGLVANAAFYLLLAGGVALFLVVVRKATALDMGLKPALPNDLLYGGLAWICALAPVYALQIGLVQLVETDRQRHPLIEMLLEERRPDLLALAVFAAVLVAPLVEEFLFRVLLQGWLETQFAPPILAEIVPATVADALHAPTSLSADVSLFVDGSQIPFDALPLYKPPAFDDPFDAFVSPQMVAVESAAANAPATSEPSGLRGCAPIGISAFLFAAAHAGTWPDPLPLFALALVLGYVYRQTHRLWPSVVLHMLFNGLSLAVVWFAVE